MGDRVLILWGHYRGIRLGMEREKSTVHPQYLSGGGMLISQDREIVRRARFLATQARDPAPHEQHSEIGYNYRKSNILAGIGRGQLRVLQSRVDARRAIFERYRQGPASTGLPEWMPEPESSVSNRWLTAATISPISEYGQDEIIRRLFGEMIEARPVWKTMHLQPIFSGARYFTDGNASIADDLFERSICPPSGSNMTDDQLNQVISTLASILA